MYLVILCSILAVFFTYLESKKICKRGMFCGFLLLTMLGAIHYEYGNDYMAYMDIYESIISHDLIWSDLIEGEIFKEPGWALLNYIFKPLGDNGFFVMVAMLNILQNVIYYRIIRKYLPIEDWTFGTFIYLFTTTLYLLNFSMMRQGLTVAIFLAICPLIEQRKMFKALLIILLASTIHSSALIFIPFVFVGYIPMSKYSGIVITGIYILVFALLLISKDFINTILSTAISFSDTFQDYADTYGDDEVTATFRLGFLLKTIPVVLSFVFINSADNDETKKRIVLISSFGILVDITTQIIPLLSRVTIYFMAYSVIAMPMVYKTIKPHILKITLLTLYVLLNVHVYYIFFKSPIWIDSYTHFNTIFSVIE